MLLQLSELLGKFHPLVVHLPIGFIVLTLLLKSSDALRPNPNIKALLPLLLQLSFAAVLLATLTGYIMPKGNDFDQRLLDRHFWSGIALSLVSLGMLLPPLKKWRSYGYWLLGILVALAGHLGGTLTHGENYFQLSAAGQGAPLVQDGTLYQDHIYPIFHTKCIACHNNAKSKGGLKMHEFPLLMQGGESGTVITAAHPEKSDLYQRLLLPTAHEDHMPPKGKVQPSEQEISLIKWWIERGADRNLRPADIPDNDPIHKLLQALAVVPTAPKAALPKRAPLSLEVINNLATRGARLVPIDQALHYYKLIYSTTDTLATDELAAIKTQVLEFQMDNDTLSAQLCSLLSTFPNLQKLRLYRCHFAKGGLLHLDNMQQLAVLNLSGSTGTVENIATKQLPPSLQNIYLFDSDFIPLFQSLAPHHPRIQIDTGGYQVPTLASDTLRL